MKRSMSVIRFGRWDDDSNRPHKISKYSPTNDAGSSNIEEESLLTRLINPFVVSYYGNEITPEEKRKSPSLKKKSSSSSIVEITKGVFEEEEGKRKSPPLKKRSSSSSIVEITKGVFDSAVTHDGGVKKSSAWVKSQFLGRGSYGSVYLATSKNEKEKKIMAIKSAEISRASSLKEEKRILTRLLSPFVVRCYGHEIAREEALFGGERTNYNLILEYCSGQSLADLIENNGGGLLEKDVKEFARDILDGLDYIHRENIVHCDIKPDNILLTPIDNRIRPNGYVIKIGDFGLALEKGSSEYGNGTGHQRGTTRYMAPELISQGIVDFGVDTWAFGCTVLEMLTGQVAWGEHSDLGPVDWDYLIGQSDFIPYIPDWLSEEAQDFLSRCLVKEPGSRWGIGALMNHPFFNLDVELSDNGFVYD